MFDSNGVAKICFTIVNGPAPINAPLRLALPSGTLGLEIFVSGLYLSDTRTSTSTPLLTIDSPIKVTLLNPKITGATHGIVLRGTGQHEVIGTNNVGDIACAANSAGNGMLIQSPGAKIKGMNVHGCGEGIRITANDALIGAAFADSYDVEKNTIHGNGVGIHVVSGERNKFAWNSIYKNPGGSVDGRSDDGILMDEPLLSSLGRPEILFVNQQTEEALRCQKDQAGQIISRTLQFQVPAVGEIIILQAEDRDRQGKTYLTKCTVDQSGVCQFQWPATVQVDPTVCGINIFAVALLQTADHSTVYTSSRFLLDGRRATVQTVALPTPVPTASGADGSQQSTDLTTSAPTLDPGMQFRDTGAGGTTGVSAGCSNSLLPRRTIEFTSSIFFLASIGILFLIRKEKIVRR
ncbi:MAG: right-handed parallel beta-helix repeat-containing protein [Deltaproteobacteria bacterium]|nr:right-handed parallel beta-helix repeat-containing protein [Deltaproteobacteria bacterium]